MNIRRAYKLSLNNEEHIRRCLEYLDDNMLEVQLLNLEDKLENMNRFADKICSIHLPLGLYTNKPLCNISSMGEALLKQDEYYEYLLRLAAISVPLNVGWVVHADIPVRTLMKMPYFQELMKFVDEQHIKLHIENVTNEIGSAMMAINAPVEIARCINYQNDRTCAYPLLDICHFQMVQQSYDSNLRMNLKEVIKFYSSDNFFMHFNSSAGSGDSHTGGFHSFNFSDNRELLNHILEDIKNYNPLLVLECNEKDLLEKPNARWLNDYIENFLNKTVV